MGLNDIRHFALDMDGTVYKGETWLDGARDFLRAVEETGRDYVFLTNNSSKSKALYVEKLRRMGLDARPGQVLTSGEAAARYVRLEYPGARVCLLGNDILRREFAEGGVVLDDDRPDVMMSAFDTELDYEKLRRFCDFARAGLPYLATHPDVNCPTETGFMPDIGAIHAFVQASTGRAPDVIIGKPHAPMAAYLFSQTGWEKAATAAVGDRLTTDVALALNHGFTGALVLSGATSRAEADASDIRPHYVFESVKDMISLLYTERACTHEKISLVRLSQPL